MIRLSPNFVLVRAARTALILISLTDIHFAVTKVIRSEQNFTVKLERAGLANPKTCADLCEGPGAADSEGRATATDRVRIEVCWRPWGAEAPAGERESTNQQHATSL